MPEAYLVNVHQNDRRWPLPSADGATVVIGREAPAELVFAAAPVSRRHASITCRDGQHWLSDLGSRNGTFLNGAPVPGDAKRLIDGDEIVIGGAVALRFHDPTQTVKGERIGRLQGVWMNERTGDVWVDGARLDPPLSAAQIALITLLYGAAGQFVARDAIVAHVWPSDDPQGISEEALDGLIKRLRARLREASPGTDYIEIARGRGIRLKTP